jgi:ubiquinone/menaquinone biosynthesis C-methylase UbiE
MKNFNDVRRLFKFILTSPLTYFVSFNTTLRLLEFFGFDKQWSWYLRKRKLIPSYFYSLLSLSLIKKGDSVLDIGCGAGQILPELEDKVGKFGRVNAIDSFFLNVLLSQRFHAKRAVVDVVNAERLLPFKSKSFDVVHANDTFQYINNKLRFIKECHRVLKNNGKLIILQTLSKPRGNIFGISYKKTKNLLRKSGFKTFGFFSNRSLLKMIENKKGFKLGTSDAKNNLEKAFSYSFFGVKGKGEYSINVSDKLSKRFKNTKVDYSQETWLKD